MDHRADIQTFVEQRVKVHGTVAVSKHLQRVFDVLSLLGDDRFEQDFEDFPDDPFSRYLGLIETEKAILLIQVQQSEELVFVTPGEKFVLQRLLEIFVILEQLQALGGRIKKRVRFADHQRTRQFHVIGGVFPQPYAFHHRKTDGGRNRIYQLMHGVELLAIEDPGFALEHPFAASLVFQHLSEEDTTGGANGGGGVPETFQFAKQQHRQPPRSVLDDIFPDSLIVNCRFSARIGKRRLPARRPVLMSVIRQYCLTQAHGFGPVPVGQFHGAGAVTGKRTESDACIFLPQCPEMWLERVIQYRLQHVRERGDGLQFGAQGFGVQCLSLLEACTLFFEYIPVDNAEGH
ncbi:hypothetical protein [Pseudomonas fluorescens]|uniref:hypothetical protein n=1 Tax=Pseudomonas fluorescens TaxID=294 RepID=UPI001EE3B9B5|nr:hypothetical protein [Pseudomonas fluorescens]